MAQIDAPYQYRKALLQRQAQPSEIASTPDLAEVAAAHAAGRSQTEAEAENFTRDAAQNQKALAEKDRQFLSQMSLDREKLDTWGRQNSWATAIAVANLGLSALSIPAAMKTTERQQAHETRMEGIAGRNVTAVEEGNRLMAAQQKALDEEREMRRINNPAFVGEAGATTGGGVGGVGVYAPVEVSTPAGEARPDDLATIMRRKLTAAGASLID